MNMNGKVLLIGRAALFARALVVALIAACVWGWTIPRADAAELVIHSGNARHNFTVEIADTPENRARGLMFRKSLAENAGMLFIYPRKARVTMWMKNTYLSLDMLFLDGDGTILHIAERAVPLSTDVISSRRRVSAVLEILGGTVERLGIGIGDRVEHARLGSN